MVKFQIISLLCAMVLSSCNDGDFVEARFNELQIGQKISGSVTYKTLKGEVKDNLILTKADAWLLVGGLYVADGATLTIEKGTTVYADANTETPLISVRQGGKIVADGTAAEPIIFTSIKTLDDLAEKGDWGGIIINGKAHTNLGFAGESEGGAGFYGGDNDQDNSGILRYVRIEYAGLVYGEDNELNGLSLNAVGAGTTLEYIQTFQCADDGFEFFGGSCHLRYAVSTGNGDDSFDWTFGWNGYGQFWVIDQGQEGDNGIEADNNENDFGATPWSSPTLSNLTVVSRGGNTGVLLRRGTQGQLYNGIVTGFNKSAVEVKEDAFILGHLENGLLGVSYFSVFQNKGDFQGAGNVSALPGNDSKKVPLSDTFVGSAPTDVNPSTLNAWFADAPFRGAIENTNLDWTKGWVRNLDGSLR